MRNKIILFLFFLSALIIPPFLGDQSISVSDLWTDLDDLTAYIIFQVRLPRIVFAFAVGAGLAMVGAVFQALLKNDLATPYTLGVSSGGALGAVLAIKSGLDVHFFGFSTISLFSMLGSLVTLVILYFVAYKRRGFSSYTLILAGVTISLTFSALILFVHYLADFTETYRMVRWLMGGLEVSGWHFPVFLLILLFLTSLYFLYRVEAFNLLLTGDDLAKTKGVSVQRLQILSFILAAILIGAIVSLAGPIGFVGLIVPHVVRLLFGPDHRHVFPLSILAGGAFLIWCDTFARMTIYPAELPVGIITSLFGGPFFIFLLLKAKI